MKKYKLLLIGIVFFFNNWGFSQDSLLNKINIYFEKYKTIAEKDNGKLWGVSFDVPIEIEIPQYHFLIVNRKVSDTLQFIHYKNLYYKSTVETLGGSGEVKWGGYHWAKCSWTIINDDSTRMINMFHEAFHRNQELLQLKGIWSQNIHLNKSEARILLRLELNALKQALIDSNYSSILTDALTFRAFRYHLFPKAKKDESLLELQEGLASYTGFKLGGGDRRNVYIYCHNAKYNQQSYAYITGLLYGYIFDRYHKQWTKYFSKNDNFMTFANKQFSIYVPKKLKKTVEQIRIKYGWTEIQSYEDSINSIIEMKNRKYDSLFFLNPVLTLDKSETLQMIFKSAEMFPFKDGKVFNNVILKDKWGILKSQGVIMISKRILISAPISIQGNTIEGDGWKLELNEHWALKKRRNCYVLQIKK